MTLLLVLLGAAVGAPLRYLTDRFVQSRHVGRRAQPARRTAGTGVSRRGTSRVEFPWGTWSVNVGGSFVLGVVAAAWTGGALPALLGTGFCGALTTWSTFGYETVRLMEEGDLRRGLAYLGSSVAAGLVAAFAGAGIVSALVA